VALIELKEVAYRYPHAATWALEHLHLTIEAGEFVLLAGASGSGKSTLCRLLNGLIPHLYGGTLVGSVHVQGLDTRAHSVAELFAHVGLVFQNPEAQLFNSSVEREIIFGLESLGLPPAEIRARVAWALEQTQLTHLRARAPFELSTGEQQTVVIAAMLALRPALLVLDEPYAHLDPAAVARVRALLRAIHAQGTSIVLTEHRLYTSLADATRLIVLERGRIVRDGVPRVVLREDVSAWRLNIPYVVQLARRAGWPTLPLSVDEALTLARRYDNIAMPRRAPARRVTRAPASRVIEMHQVSYAREGRTIFRDVSLEIAAGESIALLGRNGAGKTTFLKLLNGLCVPTQGYVRVLNQDTRYTRVATLAHAVGIVFQNPDAQFFKTTVREEIEVAPRALRRYDAAWLEELYEWFELTPLLERPPLTLSEGEKKRVALVATLAMQPAILALDEPTTGQDAVSRATLIRLIQTLQTRGVTILIATHDVELAEQVAARWLVLGEGTLLADAPPEAIQHPRSLLARAALQPTEQWEFEQAWLQQTLQQPLVSVEEDNNV